MDHHATDCLTSSPAAGTLLKRRSRHLIKSWDCRYFEVEGFHLVYHNHHNNNNKKPPALKALSSLSSSSSSSSPPLSRRTISLVGATITPLPSYDDPASPLFPFEIHHPHRNGNKNNNKTLRLAASTPSERDHWVNVLTAVAAGRSITTITTTTSTTSTKITAPPTTTKTRATTTR